MKIKMIKDSAGMANSIGSVSMTYEAGVTYDMTEDWQKGIAQVFINEGWAEEIGKIEKKVVKPKETKEEKPKKKTKKG
tara:strand:- start:245 stop:478 length:234 start_codon:yes stop_codon:yes gene_type:complete